MIRSYLLCMVLAIAPCASTLLAQGPASEEPADLHVELRSATGSRRFQIGEVIALELLLSSSTPKRYLEPCMLFAREIAFGFPQCRFFTSWSLVISPEDGWVDLTKKIDGRRTGGGPSFDVPEHDLTSQPVTFSYLLTNRYRFEKPGEYHVRVSFGIGLDDETTKRGRKADAKEKPHSVGIIREIALQIIPADPEWQKGVVRKGLEAYSTPSPRVTAPPSEELLRYRHDTQALCTLGTPDAARALAKVLSSGHSDVQLCLRQSPSIPAAIEEMQRLLVDPEVGVRPDFFTLLVALQGSGAKGESLVLSQPIVDRECERLFAALPQKRADARVRSLLTVLHNPRQSKGSPYEFAYPIPFAPPVIAAVIAGFDQFERHEQDWVLKEGWDRVRSPMMLPLVRRLAQSGNGQALLRWLELDPAPAMTFVREEVARRPPRFSSFYLRLPDISLPAQEQQIAENFVALAQEPGLTNEATLLQRYATAAVLPTVLPFIDAKLAGWSYSAQVPVLAYLLKVSPEQGAPRVEQALQQVNHGPWRTNTFFTDIGFLQPSPILENLALAQIEAGAPLARDAADYLRRFASPAVKPLVWTQLSLWHNRFVASGASKRYLLPEATQEDRFQQALVNALGEAYVRAQAWVLTPDEANRVRTELGEKTDAGLKCMFSCAGELSVGPAPGSFYIYGRASWRWPPAGPRMEYLNAQERLYYSVNQYSCPTLGALKQKLLQFPPGSSFGFAWDFTERDRSELVEIGDFLQSHGFRVQNPQHWNFLRLDPVTRTIPVP